MTLSYAEAVAQITAPGERFETGDVTIAGVTYTAFTTVPTHLRDLFADWKLELLEESQVRRSQPADGHIFSSWKVVARKVDY